MSRDIEVGDKVVRKADPRSPKAVYDVYGILGEHIWIAPEGKTDPLTYNLDNYELVPEPKWEEGAVYNHPMDDGFWPTAVDYYCIHVNDDGSALLTWFSPTYKAVQTSEVTASSRLSHTLKGEKKDA